MSVTDFIVRRPVRSLLVTALAALSLSACSQEDEVKADSLERLTDAEARGLMARHYCNACHEADEFRIGPSYRDVAIRYAESDGDQTDWLAKKIRQGGAGNWGAVPMVSNPRLAEADAQRLAHWILTLEPTEP